MRKIFYASALFVAAIAVGCGNNQKPAADANGVTDSLEQMDTTGVAASVSESEVKENIASGINNLKTMIENKSASDFTAKLTEVQNNIQQLVQKDPEAAKQYVAQLQEFLKQNSASIKTYAGEQANGLVNALVNTPAPSIVDALSKGNSDIDKLSSDVQKAADDINKAKEDISRAKEEGKKALDEAVQAKKEEVRNQVQNAVDSKKQEAAKAIDKGVSDLKSKMGLQ